MYAIQTPSLVCHGLHFYTWRKQSDTHSWCDTLNLIIYTQLSYAKTAFFVTSSEDSVKRERSLARAPSQFLDLLKKNRSLYTSIDGKFGWLLALAQRVDLERVILLEWIYTSVLVCMHAHLWYRPAVCCKQQIYHSSFITSEQDSVFENLDRKCCNVKWLFGNAIYGSSLWTPNRSWQATVFKVTQAKTNPLSQRPSH